MHLKWSALLVRKQNMECLQLQVGILQVQLNPAPAFDVVQMRTWSWMMVGCLHRRPHPCQRVGPQAQPPLHQAMTMLRATTAMAARCKNAMHGMNIPDVDLEDCSSACHIVGLYLLLQEGCGSLWCEAYACTGYHAAVLLQACCALSCDCCCSVPYKPT